MRSATARVYGHGRVCHLDPDSETKVTHLRLAGRLGRSSVLRRYVHLPVRHGERHGPVAVRSVGGYAGVLQGASGSMAPGGRMCSGRPRSRRSPAAGGRAPPAGRGPSCRGAAPSSPRRRAGRAAGAPRSRRRLTAGGRRRRSSTIATTARGLGSSGAGPPGRGSGESTRISRPPARRLIGATACTIRTPRRAASSRTACSPGCGLPSPPSSRRPTG